MLVLRRITQTVKIPELGEKIQAAQARSRMNVTEVCQRVGISRTYWYKIINDNIPDGLAEPTLRKIEDFDNK